MITHKKFVVGLGTGICALLVCAFGISSLHGPDHGITLKTAAQAARVSNDPRGQAPAFGQSQALQSSPRTALAAPSVVQISPLPANATFVPDENLQQLSLMVNLAGAGNQQPDKSQWTQAVAVSKKLLEGPCDCAQRIWLKNFIEMGNYALTNSDAKYHEIARVMATLGRNDSQSIAFSRKPAMNH